jgi:hypothetical protein
MPVRFEMLLIFEILGVGFDAFTALTPTRFMGIDEACQLNLYIIIIQLRTSLRSTRYLLRYTDLFEKYSLLARGHVWQA